MKTIHHKKSRCGTTAGVLASSWRGLCLGLCLSVLAGCSLDDDGAVRQPYALVFDACVGSTGSLATRARNDSDVTNITNQFYGENDFYITVASTEQGETTLQSGIYEIPSASSGTLLPKAGQTALTWQSRTAGHEFWAWSVRRDMELVPDESATDAYKIEFKGSTLNETVLTTSTSSVSNPWKSEPDENAPELWRNGEVLEKLISAKTGTGTDPLIYNNNGMYVTLQFRHLVSKIFLKNLIVVDNVAGSSSSTLRGHITFYGMPDEATLYVAPTDAEGNRIAPYVAMPENWDYNPTRSVTYALTNNSVSYTWEGYYDSNGNLVTSSKPDESSNATNMRDCWYVCPELDLSKLAFKIELYDYNATDQTWVLSQSHSKHGAVYGDFQNVKFSRTTTGKDYDDPNNTTDQKWDESILHAGEYLMLSMSISEKGNPTAQGTIVSGWFTGSRTGSSHVHQGLYSVGDVTQMSTIMSGSDETAKQQYYEMMGSGRDTSSDDKNQYPEYKDKDGNEVDLKIFELFDDIGTNSYDSGTSSNKVSSLNPGDGYILDGRGHTVNFTGSSGEVTIGNVRDVYLRWYYSYSSTTSEYIVYVDKTGNVWLVDPVTFEHTPTEYNVNDIPGKKSIDLKTGEIKAS